MDHASGEFGFLFILRRFFSLIVKIVKRYFINYQINRNGKMTNEKQKKRKRFALDILVSSR